MRYLVESTLLIIITLLCWLRGYHLNLEAQGSMNRFPDEGASSTPKLNFSSVWQGAESPAATAIESDSLQNVFYFLHISDLHVSKFAKKGGAAHLHTFLRHTLPFYNPPFVAVTGDLTDAKSAYKLASHQHQTEWQTYYDTLKQYGVLEREQNAQNNSARFWIDLRGNHDTFDVGGWNSTENYYRNYSVSKRKNYQYVHSPGFGRYNFVVLDGCPDVGPGRPFNFFSAIEARDMDFLAQSMVSSKQYNHTVVLSHYPISDTMFGRTSKAPFYSIDDVASGISLWLCGHYHTLVLGLGKTLMAYHESLKILDLEIGDTKLHAFYRVMAFDNDFVSFRDLRQQLPPGPLNHADVDNIHSLIGHEHRSPVVLITYPKNARHLLPEHEPLSRLKESRHMRFFIWGRRVYNSSEVSAKVDGLHVPTDQLKYIGRGKPAEKLKVAYTGPENDYLPMYTLPFKTLQFADGAEHTLEISVVDGETGMCDSQTILFSFTGTRSLLNAGAGEVIMSTLMERFVKDMFVLVYFGIVLGMILLPRLFYLYLKANDKWLGYKAATAERLIKQDGRTIRYSILSRQRSTRKKNPWTPLQQVLYELVTSVLTFSGIQRTVVHTISDLAWFVEATIFRFTHLAAQEKLWYPLFAYSVYITAGPFFWGHLVSSLSVTSDTLNPWTVWSKLQGFYIYGVRLGQVTAPYSPSFSYQWIPLLDSWLFAFFEVTYCLGYLALYLAFVVTPTTLLYSSDNERRAFPVHRSLAIRLLVASCVFYQVVTVMVMGLFYGWATIIFSPGKTLFCIWAVYALKLYLLDYKLDMVNVYVSNPTEKGH